MGLSTGVGVGCWEVGAGFRFRGPGVTVEGAEGVGGGRVVCFF